MYLFNLHIQSANYDYVCGLFFRCTMNTRSSHNELPTRSTTNTQTFLVTCVLDADYEALEEHLRTNSIEQSDLDKSLYCGLRIVQLDERELSHVAPALTILLQSGAKWNRNALLDKQKTPLHIICESSGDHHELLELVIKSSQRTIIDARDIHKFTAVYYAVKNANINCIKCLIANGADVTLGDDRYQALEYDENPISQAIKQSSLISSDIFDLLIDAAVNQNIDYIKNCTLYLQSAYYNRNVKYMKKLIKLGAPLDIITFDGIYVWVLIARLGTVELLKCMFNRGFDKDSVDQNGLSVLCWVVYSGNIKAVRFLLELGVGIRVNAIMEALPYIKVEIIALYIRNGFNVNCTAIDPTCGNIVSLFEASILHRRYYISVMLLISGCSRGVFTTRELKDKPKPKLEKLMKEWNVWENNSTPLQQRCRSVILNQLYPRADLKIEKLPLPQCLIKYLSISELDDIVHEYNKP